MTSPFGFDGPAEIIAHRGYSARAPENTLAAVELALSVGATAVEFDLHCADDGTAFLFHDATLNRTSNGVGPIREWAPDALRRLDAGAWFSREFVGEPIPTFDSVLQALRGRVRTLYPEIKGYREPDDVGRITAAVVDAGMLEQTVFISLDWTSLAIVRDRVPEARIGYVVEKEERVERAFELADGDERALLDFNKRILIEDPTVAERARAAGLPLATWTVNDVDDAARLLEMGVPRITTNEVTTLLTWRDTL